MMNAQLSKLGWNRQVRCKVIVIVIVVVYLMTS